MARAENAIPEEGVLLLGLHSKNCCCLSSHSTCRNWNDKPLFQIMLGEAFDLTGYLFVYIEIWGNIQSSMNIQSCVRLPKYKLQN